MRGHMQPRKHAAVATCSCGSVSMALRVQCMARMPRAGAVHCMACVRGADAARAQVVIPMKLFEHSSIVAAQRKHAIQKTGNMDSRVNRKRGRFEEAAGSTIVPDLDRMRL
jgi:polyferredoxin